MKNIFITLALLALTSLHALADTADKWEGTWRPIDPIMGNTAFILKSEAAGVFRLILESNGTIQDFGTTRLVKESSGLSGTCGEITEYLLIYPVPGKEFTDFKLAKHYCPDGSNYDKVNHLNWFYDTVYSSDNGKMKDATIFATLKLVE